MHRFYWQRCCSTGAVRPVRLELRSRLRTLQSKQWSHRAEAHMPTTPPSTKLSRTHVALHRPRGPAAEQLKVLQWNTLADGLAQHGDFTKVPHEVLEWSFRAPLVLAEILESGADIICLQECNHFGDLQASLQPHGYEGAFYAKRQSPACRYDFPPDGLALFYRTTRFQQKVPPSGHPFLTDTGCHQSQGFLAVQLYDTVVGRDVLVVTTHLKAKEGCELDEMRLHQAQQLLHWVGTASQQGADAANAEAARAEAAKAVCAPPPVSAGASLVSANGTSAVSAVRVTAATAAAGSNGAGPHPHNCECCTCGGSLSSAEVEGLSTVTRTGTAPTTAATAAGVSEGTTLLGAMCPNEDNSNGNGAVGMRAEGGHGGVGSNGVSPGCSSSGNGASSANGNGATGRGAATTKIRGVPVIVTGDFNTTSGSLACQALASHPIGLQSLWDEQPSSDSGAAAAAPCGGNGHGAGGNGTGLSRADTPCEFTTWKYRSCGEAKRTIDYIFFTPASLRPVSRWRMLSEAEIGPQGLPSAAYGSDHMAVCATFEWRHD